MPPAHAPMPRPARIVGELLTGHPEAASLLAEASHRRALAACSAAAAGQEFAAALAARLGWEGLRRRLDPRRHRPVHFGAGLVLLAGMGAGLTVLDGIELGGALAGRPAVLAAIAATTVWLTGAWLAALASRERRRAMVAGLAGGAIALSLLLMALHNLNAPGSWPMVREHFRAGAILGVLDGVLLLALATGAAALMTHLEPACVYLARRRWRRARAGHDAARRLERADIEAASVAREAWLGLVRSRAIAAGGEGGEGGEHVVEEALALASALQEGGGPRLSPPVSPGPA